MKAWYQGRCSSEGGGGKIRGEVFLKKAGKGALKELVAMIRGGCCQSGLEREQVIRNRDHQN
jgi:hypothetical protein